MGYRASAALETFIIENAPLHEATLDAPSSYEELRGALSQLSSYDPIPVYSGGCDDTIYSTPAVNHALRAWHDSVHYNESLTFTLGDELEVARQQCLDAGSMAIEYDLTEADIQALYYDLAGQRAYYAQHGTYVEEQGRFVEACLDRGLVKVLASGEVF